MSPTHRSLQSSLKISVLAFLVFLSCATTTRAVTFDWASAPAGSWNTVLASGTSETVDYFKGGSGFGVAVTVFNNGETLATDTGGTGAPAVFTTGTGFLDGGTNTRGLVFNASTTASTASYSQVTINFNYVNGVKNVSFAIWDVDSGGGWIDKIANISATAVGGATVFPTTFTSAVAGFNTIAGANGTLAATGTASAANTGANGNQGNINVAFTQNVTSITFQYSNALAGTRTTQHIGVGDITFTANGAAFPEVGSAAGSLALCGGMLLGCRVRRRKGSGAASA